MPILYQRMNFTLASMTSSLLLVLLPRPTNLVAKGFARRKDKRKQAVQKDKAKRVSCFSAF